MRVLWFTNTPAPEMIRCAGQGNEGYGGHWMAELLRHVRERRDIELGVVTASPGMRDTRFTVGNLTYYVISQPAKFNAFAMRRVDLQKCVEIIDEFGPDVIHIHGSERFYGMVRASGLTDIRTLVSIQGLLGSFADPRHFFGALSLVEIIKSLRLLELPVRLGLAWQYYYARKGARREVKILSSADGFLGRTRWDRAHVMRYNRGVQYYHVGEILRPTFYDSRWSFQRCQPHTLIYTNAGHPNRGTENLLKAMVLLRDEFPDIRLRLAGRVSKRGGYGRFVQRNIRRLGLNGQVDFLGYLDDKQMASALIDSHVFVISSYIENSPNSLAEAMLVGMPCIASFVGGIPDMITQDESGLLYPVEDVPVLADCIRRLFMDSELAIRLGENAHSIARQKHASSLVVGQLMEAYGCPRTSME